MKRRMKTTKFAFVLALFGATGCSLIGISTTEEPNFNVLLSDNYFEIREYDKTVVVETTVEKDYSEASDEAFRRLFKYISGANLASQKISMTAPVAMQNADSSASQKSKFFKERSTSGWKMGFVLPSEFDLNTSPKPESDLLVVRSVPAKRVAVASFTGRWKVEKYNEVAQELTAWLDQTNLKISSSPTAAAYDPPWTILFCGETRST